MPFVSAPYSKDNETNELLIDENSNDDQIERASDQVDNRATVVEHHRPIASNVTDTSDSQAVESERRPQPENQPEQVQQEQQQEQEQEQDQEKTQSSTDNVHEIEIESFAGGASRTEITHFDVLKVLGKGSFGEVFLVRKNCGNDKGALYAMKVLRKATLKIRDRLRTRMERNILVEIQHPFIVKLNYAFQTCGKLFLIMDFLRGGDLFTHLRAEIMFTEDDAKFYLAEIASALSHLHALGIIYRDLKPENILLDIEGHISLTDFGLSKIPLTLTTETDTANAPPPNQSAYSFCGTLEYMAPEIIKGNGHSFTADWWSFGVLMYEMLTGKLPFEGSSQSEIMNEILSVKLQMPPHFSSSVKLLMRQLFKRNPARRLCHNDSHESRAIKTHEFFRSINWTRLYAKLIPPPYKPVRSHDDDDAAFRDPHFVPIRYNSPGVPVSAKSHELFRGFSFVSTTIDEEEDDGDGNGNGNGTGAAGTDAAAATAAAASTVAHQLGNFHDEYDLVTCLGKGSFSDCYVCEHKTSKTKFAVKIIQKKKCNYVSEEIEILLRFGNHSGIVKLYGVYESVDERHLIMELLTGGELIEYILEKRTLNELEAAVVLRAVVDVVGHLHAHGVVHRDLKPSNILFQTRARRPFDLKICDMGFAKQLRAENGLLMTPCYTAQYAAPEILRRQGYRSACDIWSIGVVLYIMLTGETPFSLRPATEASDQTTKSTETAAAAQPKPEFLLEKIATLKTVFERAPGCLLGSEVRELLEQMFDFEPSRRPVPDQILANAWLIRSCANYCEWRNNSASERKSNRSAGDDGDGDSDGDDNTLTRSPPFKQLKIDESNYRKIRQDMNETFDAVSSLTTNRQQQLPGQSQQSTAPLGPIGMSALAKRRLDRQQSQSQPQQQQQQQLPSPPLPPLPPSTSRNPDE